MKKFLLSLAAVALAGSAWATEEKFDFVNSTYGIDNERGGSEYFTTATATNGNIAIEFSTTSGNGFRFWSDGLRLYKGNVKMTVKTIDEAEISAINVNCVKALGSVSVAGDAAVSTSKGDNIFDCSSTSVDLVFNVTTNAAIASITVTYGAADTRKDPKLSFAETECTVNLGESFTAPDLTKPTTVDVTYTSSKPEVATVDATTGAVALIAAGTTTITASFEGNAEYKSGKASYTLTVVDPNAVTFDFVNNTYDMTRYTSGTDYNSDPFEFSDGLVTVTLNGRTRLWTDGLRLYSGAKATFSVPTGYKITDVVYQSTGNSSFEGVANSTTEYVISLTGTSAKALTTVNVKLEEDIQSGVESVESDSNAPKEYYNLQGVHVENPGKGLYIVRQGSKASKVIL